MTRIIVIGGGGHCRSCIDVIEAENLHQIAGIIQPTVDGEADVMGYPVIASDQDLGLLKNLTRTPLSASGKSKRHLCGSRNSMCFAIWDMNLFRSFHPRLCVTAFIYGPWIHHHASRCRKCGAVVRNCIVNNLALVEHDVVVGKHTFLPAQELMVA